MRRWWVVVVVVGSQSEVRPPVGRVRNVVGSTMGKYLYVEAAYFKPRDIGVMALPGARSFYFSVPLGGFNPSVALLPRSLRKDVRRARTSRGDAAGAPTFVATFRHKGNLCRWLSEPRQRSSPKRRSRKKKRRKLQEGQRTRREEKQKKSEFQTSVAILDNSLKHLEYVVDEAGKPWDFGLEDVRLDFSESYGERILTTAMDYPRKGKRVLAERWHARWLDLKVNRTSKALQALSNPLRHPDVAGEPMLLNSGRNFGVLWDGHYDHAFNILHWLSDSTIDVRRGIPPMPPSEDDQQQTSHRKRGIEGANHSLLHNNGSPRRVGSRCPGVRMALGHVHLDSTMPAYRRNEVGATPYGNTYLHYFVFFEENPPFRLIQTSPAFCVPSPRDPSKCETIQFSSGFTFLNQNQLILTYGINDCEAAYAIVDVPALLNFSFPSENHRCSSDRR